MFTGLEVKGDETQDPYNTFKIIILAYCTFPYGLLEFLKSGQVHISHSITI